MATDASDEPLDDALDHALDLDFELDFDQDDAPPVRRKVRGGQMIGAAMIGLAEVLETRPKVEVPITVEVSGDPPNIDTDGLDEPWGSTGERMVAPPMDNIRSKSKGKTTKRRR